MKSPAAKSFFCFLVFLCLMLPGLFAQSFYYVEKTSGDARFIQHLTWEQREFSYRYEVVIEKQNAAGAYTEVLREFREETFIEVSMTAGRYRYRVVVYDLLNRPGEIPAWMPLEIFPALQPELTDFEPKTFYLNGEAPCEIRLSGNNFVPDSRISLRSVESNEDAIPSVQFIAYPSGNAIVASKSPAASNSKSAESVATATSVFPDVTS
jgi:hypothetical protein